MTFLLLTIFVSVAAVGIGVAVFLERRRGVHRHLRRSIVIHTTDSRSIKGVLIAEYVDSLELTHAEYLHGGEESLLAGTILVPRSRIAFVQIVPAGAAE